MEIKPTPLQEFSSKLTRKKEVSLFVKREDLNHPEVSGNKLRKLKYNLHEAKKQGKTKLLTFGGAYSNHIYATAAAGKIQGFETIGVIRGEEHLPLNPTLEFAQSCGMHFHYLDRTRYRLKDSQLVLNDLKRLYGDFYLIPEGGTNEFAIKGVQEVLSEEEKEFDYFCLSVGTGGTIAGIIQSLKGKGNIIGLSALKGDFLEVEINSLFRQFNLREFNNWHVNQNYHFGGYAKTSDDLFHFIREMEEQHDLPLDPIYTGKSFYGLLDLIRQDKFATGSKIMFIHTGGLQGRAGKGI